MTTMERYQPPYKVSQKMLDQIEEICTMLEQLSAAAAFPQSSAPLKDVQTRSIHASLKIEANPLNLKQCAM